MARERTDINMAVRSQQRGLEGRTTGESHVALRERRTGHVTGQNASLQRAQFEKACHECLKDIGWTEKGDSRDSAAATTCPGRIHGGTIPLSYVTVPADEALHFDRTLEGANSESALSPGLVPTKVHGALILITEAHSQNV